MWHCAWNINIKQILSRYGILDDKSLSSYMHHAIAKSYMFSWVPTLPPYDWTWKELIDDQLISLQRREHSDWQHNTSKFGKKYISLQLGVKLRNATIFVPILTLSFFFLEHFHCCYIYFPHSYMYNYYNYLEPCALNANFQHFIPKWYKKLPYFADLTQSGDRGWKQAQR